LAALNRFISRSAERSLPFLKTLRGAKDFAWGPEQAAAFASLKQYLSELAVLTSPDSSLPVLLYVAASPHAVSAALVQEQTVEGVIRQWPVYYVSEVLTPSKCNMTELEKIAYAVVMSSRKLRHYFEAFKVRVTSDRGLGKLFRNPEASVRIAKWAAELSGYHINFEPRTAIKSQVLAEADALAKAAARGESLPSDVFFHVIGTPAVRSPEGLQITNDSEGHRIVNLIMTEDWRAPITLFLQGYYHPTDISEAKRLKHQSRDFALIEGQLYKKGVSQPMLKCVTETEGIQILHEVHSGTCGSHAGLRALAAKVIRQGFYWPAMICAANRVTRSCEACQKFSPRSGSPSQFTKLIAHTWPLQRWGLDIVGPLPTAQGNLKFAFVAVEYFTKWIEARAVSTITSKTAQKFFWQNIVCRFGVPSELTVDNGKQFDSQDFKDFCFSIGTKLAFASVYHPQSNGVVERANGKIFTAVKKMLLDEKRAGGPIYYPRRSGR
jgi:hypothetical protein